MRTPKAGAARKGFGREVSRNENETYKNSFDHSFLILKLHAIIMQESS